MVSLALLDNLEIPHGWSEYFHHASCSKYTLSILQAGQLGGGKG